MVIKRLFSNNHEKNFVIGKKKKAASWVYQQENIPFSLLLI